MSNNELVRLEGIVKYFPTKGGTFYSESGILESGSMIHAVDGVDLGIERNSTLGIVGESGCGKSTLARTVLLLIKPTSGKLYLKDVT